jgi:hypothetical protein
MAEPEGFCDGCRFWEQVDVRAEVGMCRINPPVTLPIPAHNESEREWETRWPETLSVDWCGQFLPVPIKTAKKAEG